MAGAWFRGAFNREPAMMISAIVAGAAIALPAVIVPIRRKMGLPTYQWDGVAATNPVRFSHGTPRKWALVAGVSPQLERFIQSRTLWRFFLAHAVSPRLRGGVAATVPL